MSSPSQQPNSTGGTPSSEQLFTVFDLDKSGSIDFDELKTMFELSSYHLKEAQILQLMKLVDFNVNGKLELHEFQTMKRILDQFHSLFAPKATHTGNIGIAQLRQVLVDTGYRFDETVLNGISRAFDPHHREEFSFGDFISIMVFLKTTQMVFTSFDVTRSGTIELNYSQFLYAALTTR